MFIIYIIECFTNIMLLNEITYEILLYNMINVIYNNIVSA